MANTNSKIKKGIFILPDRLLNANAVKKLTGMIHNERYSFTVVAICKAFKPNFCAAPTTELVSCIAIAAHNPN